MDNVNLADTRRTLMLQSISRNYDYSESILKWCITTLTALNGGALVSLMGAGELRGEVVTEAGWYFGSGVLCSVIGSFLFAYSYVTTAQNAAERLWQNNVLDRASYKDTIIYGHEGMWPAAIGFILAIASAVFLTMGGFEAASILKVK